MSSNRTFMELKSKEWRKRNREKYRSNRTFMELKLLSDNVVTYLFMVLIVPLWNWNILGLVRTQRFNSVLIVPLWNWNKTDRTGNDVRQPVLIVPLWNWNRNQRSEGISRLGSNRTFMELKFVFVRSCRFKIPSSNRTFMELKWLHQRWRIQILPLF